MSTFMYIDLQYLQPVFVPGKNNCIHVYMWLFLVCTQQLYKDWKDTVLFGFSL